MCANNMSLSENDKQYNEVSLKQQALCIILDEQEKM
jgi:hypothetical protein